MTGRSGHPAGREEGLTGRPRGGRRGGRLSGAVTAATLTAAAAIGLRRLLQRVPPGGHEAWTRTNHAGRPVSLLGGLGLGTALAAVGPVLALAARRPTPEPGPVAEVGAAPDLGLAAQIGSVPPVGPAPDLGLAAHIGSVPPVGPAPDPQIGSVPPVGAAPDLGLAAQIGSVPPVGRAMPGATDLTEVVHVVEALGRTGGLALAPALAAGAATLAGVVDDHGERLTGVPTARAKGLRGHLGALARGEVTTGALKIAVIGAGALGAAYALPGPRHPVARLADAALVAGCANLANLFDLRPGRALKVAALVLAPASVLGDDPARRRLAAGALGAVLAALPADLAARDMLGDTGANPLGAVVGVVLAADRSPVRRGVALGAVVGLTLASEKVSFSAVIDSVPALRALDRAGRPA